MATKIISKLPPRKLVTDFKSPMQKKIERIVRFELDQFHMPEWQKRIACSEIAAALLPIVIVNKMERKAKMQ